MSISINGTTGISGVDGSAATPAVQGTDSNTGEFYPAADTVAWATNGSERVRVDSTGKVGIGTTAPDALLTVNTVASFGDGAVSAPSIAHKGDLDTGVFFSAANTVDVATNGTAGMQLDSSQNLKFNSGYGSVATAYGCRAWVNFNGTGTVAIRSSGNVTSITDNGGTGSYRVNITNALVDANYGVVGTSTLGDAVNPGDSGRPIAIRSLTTSSCEVRIADGGSGADCLYVSVVIFR